MPTEKASVMIKPLSSAVKDVLRQSTAKECLWREKKRCFLSSLLAVDWMWLPHKAGECLVFLWRLVWLHSISPLPQPHQVAARLPLFLRQTQTHCGPAVLVSPGGAEVSSGGVGLTAKEEKKGCQNWGIKEVALSSWFEKGFLRIHNMLEVLRVS